MKETTESPRSKALIVMGVSGCGKSTVAELLAQRLRWEMVEGDRLHPQANVDKMRRGVALDDADREPWLDLISAQLKAWAAEGRSGVITCSALKHSYRARMLAARSDLVFVYLKGSEALIRSRVQARHHEYMPATLLHSQFDTLEEPTVDEPVLTVDAGESPDVETQAIIQALSLTVAPA